MKKRKLFIAALLVVVATSVAVVSCKKETQNVLSNKNKPSEAFSLPKVDDMCTYLKDFKQKMYESKGSESLGLDEAAWHLSSVANYDFGYINVEFNDIRFDTICAHINITDGTILLKDLGVAYAKISADLNNFYQSLNLNDKHIRFIDATISGSGDVTISIVTTFKTDSKGWNEYHWYYPNTNEHFYYADSVCEAYFSEDLDYVWDGFGKTELVRLLNYTESHNINIISDGRQSYYRTRIHTFKFEDMIVDPFGSPSNLNNRLYGYLGNPYHLISKEDMCYYLDSYLGMGYKYLIDNPIQYYADECPAIWSISCGNDVFHQDHSLTYFHNLQVTYCYSYSNNSIFD